MIINPFANMKATLIAATLLSVSNTVVQAANCGGMGSGSSGIGQCAGRSGNYEDRELFCGSLAGQGSWRRTCEHGRNNQNCHFEYQGPGMPQQMCWDAFENIINQCFKTQNGAGYHYGTWDWDGHWFAIDRCSS